MSEAITFWIIVRCGELKSPTSSVSDLQSIALEVEQAVSLALLATTGGAIEVEKVIVDHTPVTPTYEGVS